MEPSMEHVSKSTPDNRGVRSSVKRHDASSACTYACVPEWVFFLQCIEFQIENAGPAARSQEPALKDTHQCVNYPSSFSAL